MKQSDAVQQAELQAAAQVSPGLLRRKILVVEDDGPLARFLYRTLREANHDVQLAGDGSTALSLLGPSLDLVLLDRNLPDGDGLDVLHALRQLFPNLPVLMLTARASTDDTVSALHSGANDYLTKPFSYIELLARVNALLRREGAVLLPLMRVADLTLSRAQHRVERGGQRIDLTPREFRLLEFLMRSPGTPIPRATLIAEVWDVADPGSNIVDVYMKYLRDKVDTGHELRLIRTVRGVGFMISED